MRFCAHLVHKTLQVILVSDIGGGLAVQD